MKDRFQIPCNQLPRYISNSAADRFSPPCIASAPEYIMRQCLRALRSLSSRIQNPEGVCLATRPGIPVKTCSTQQAMRLSEANLDCLRTPSSKIKHAHAAWSFSRFWDSKATRLLPVMQFHEPAIMSRIPMFTNDYQSFGATRCGFVLGPFI